jgi:hypothetical protein
LQVSFDLRELVENLSDEERGLFFENVVFEEKLLKCFADISTSDYAFDQGLYSTTYGLGPIRRLAGELRKTVLSNLDETYKTEIKQMKSDLDGYAKDAEEWRNKFWALERKVDEMKRLIRSNGYISFDGLGFNCQEIKREEK